LNLGELDTLKDIEGRLGEGPVDNSPQFEQKGDVIPNLEDCFAVHIVTPHHKSALFQFGQPDPDLVRLQP
jgi:hypothetical protein